MKKLFLLSSLAISVIAFSCKKDEVAVNPDKIYQVSTSLSGANELPMVTTSATGTTTGTYNQTTKMLMVSTTLNGITPTAGHIHTQTVPTTATKSGGVTFPFTSLTSPVSFMTTLTTAQETDLLNGIMYVNFHTPANPGGEIRGNLMLK